MWRRRRVCDARSSINMLKDHHHFNHDALLRLRAACRWETRQPINATANDPPPGARFSNVPASYNDSVHHGDTTLLDWDGKVAVVSSGSPYVRTTRQRVKVSLCKLPANGADGSATMHFLRGSHATSSDPGIKSRNALLLCVL